MLEKAAHASNYSSHWKPALAFWSDFCFAAIGRGCVAGLGKVGLLLAC